MFVLYTLFLIVPVIVMGVVLVKQRYRYWKDRGIPYIEPSFPKGNLGILKESEHLFELPKRIYLELKGKGKPLGGVFVTIKPAAIVLDLDIVKTMLVKDFQHFQDRGFYINERDDPIGANLLTIKGDPWKKLRLKLSPTFTNSKMKLMLPIMMETSEKFIKRLDEDIKKNNELELGDYLSCFAIDIIGSCGFGIDCNSLNNPNTDFLRMGKKVFSHTKGRFLKKLFVTLFPNLAYKFRIKETLSEVNNFYTKLVTEVVTHREINNIQRNDFLNMLIQLKNNKEPNGRSGKDIGSLSLNEIISNTYLFLLAGYETTAITLEFCFLELAHHPEIQNRLRDEIKTVFDKCDNKVTYEALSELKYLDKVAYEAMRKHPVVGFFARFINEDQHIENTDIVLEKGTPVIFSPLGIHHDPEIYPDPEKFDPERFSPEAIKARHPCAFLGFGEGPRNCVGSRFAMTEIRIAISCLLMNYHFSPCDKTKYPIEYSNSNSLLSPAGGCWLKVEKIS